MGYSQDDMPRHLEPGQLVLEELQDELMIYDPARQKAFCLSPTAFFLWKHLDGSRSIGEIIGLMGERLGKAVPEEVVWLALDLLAKDGLLAKDTLLADDPSASTALARRSLLRRFSVGAATAIPLATILLVMPATARGSHATARALGTTARAHFRQASGQCRRD